MEFVAVAAILLLPIFFVFFIRSCKPSTISNATFLRNQGRNGMVATLAGAIAGNVGIGSFLALFLFANQSPVIGFSIVGAYTLGLVLCAIVAPLIRKAADRYEASGLIDLIVATHGVKVPLSVWLPLAVVFILRSAVQLSALGLLTSAFFGGQTAIAIVICATLIALYLQIGGYKAAVETDVVQAVVIVLVGLICAFGLADLDGTPTPFFDLGPYKPAILVGIWLFIPWSALLAVDNWQRITLAETTGTAQVSYLVASLICGGLFWMMAAAGYWAADGDTMYDTFAKLAPEGLVWLPIAMFIACIMSSIDTFVMPLVTGVGRKMTLGQLRALIAALMALTAVTAIAFTDALDTIIAAFNSLTVFLPVAFGALFIKNPPPLAAPVSMNLGLFAAIGYSMIDQNIASLVGFSAAAICYILFVRLQRYGSQNS